MNLHRLLVGLSCAIWCAASAQYTFSNVSLYRQFNLTEFLVPSGNGNGCWGYTSPSGREYALMGLNTKIAVVEITDPANADWFTSIIHTNNLSSTWADIKTYGTYCYIVTEARTGIQVVDLSNIDNHVVTLVRTIMSPEQSHTIAVDTVSGFLYTCGSRLGTGTTTCFSLANPSNPVQVGPATMTANYMHECQAVTYTSGPYAGKQIFFGCSEGRGVDIYDMTNKGLAAMPLIKRVTYPNIGYCHQGWLSADRKYFYVDDEFDENNFGYTTRTLVLDVSDLANAVYVTSFTTGLTSIDHNQYVRDGFIFQSNYRSGLRIWDANDNPTAPTQTGWFDTFPLDNAIGYDGTWSNYPFFPSGTVILSDINRGLFIFNVRDALTRKERPKSFTVLRGGLVSGGLPELLSSNNAYLTVRPGAVFANTDYSIQVQLDSSAAVSTLSRLKFHLEAGASTLNANMKIDFWDFVLGDWVEMDSRSTTTTDSTVDIDVTTNFARFKGPGKELRARIGWRQTGAVFVWPWTGRIDEAYWTVVP